MIWMKYLAYVVASIFIMLGAAILAGYFITENVPSQFRIMMGIVLILYGLFRIVITYSKRNNTIDEN